MTRLFFERLCRAVALTALLMAVWVSVRTARDVVRSPRRVVLSLPDSLVTDTGAAGVSVLRTLLGGRVSDTTHLALRGIPATPLRAAMSAMQGAGNPVSWSDSTRASGLAVSVSRAATPGAPLMVRATGSTQAPLLVRDAGGVLDSLPLGASALSWQLRSASAPLVVQQGLSVARVGVPDSSVGKRVLVIAQPGWEGKFTIAALEELGWRVDGSMRVSPSGVVTVGAPERLDLERYAAVVVLDSMAVDAASLQAFANRGGGVVFGGDALQIASLASLRPARATVLRGAIAGGLLTDDPRRGLEAWELDITAGTVVLADDRSEHGHREPALVARRSGRGRIVAMPYRETWRWRMQGSDRGAEEHRRWWHTALTAAVPSAADASRIGARANVADALPGDAAPYADLVARVGPGERTMSPSAAIVTRAADERGELGDIPRFLSAPILLLVTLLALLAEWSSRRLRGQR